ncbi:MAG: hypothetical protein F9K29_12925 [Hyphomicrobiaceae bacterium]|nr:MAG: hypothetical protein F9K29_12925 [Hyphomicrobiaceae bacterium]
MDAAAARRLHPRVALAVLMAIAGLGLAGCETSSSIGSIFGGSTNVANQEPPATAPAPQPALAKVAVAPVIGAPDAIAKQIQQEFTSAIEKQRVSVSTSKDERVDYTLRGYIVAAKDKSGTKVSYIWDVTDPTGKRVNRITGEEVVTGSSSKDPWAAVTPAVAQAIAIKAANSFAAWLPSQNAQAAVASNTAAVQPAGIGAPDAAERATTRPPRPAAKQSPNTATAAAPPPAASQTTGSIARSGPVTAVVPAVTGAPGDGSKSLTAAIQEELKSKGIALAAGPTPAAYRVEGMVTLGEARDGKQPIQIEWLVRDPQGKKLGTVSQKNEIPEGSLNGAWGKTAEQAAGAAAQGILKLLPQPRAIN